MKKFLISVFSVMLVAAMVLTFAACKNKDGDDAENVETGNFTYELVTNKDGLSCYDKDGKEIVDENGEAKKFDKYYKVTGFTVSADDLDKIALGDYSTVEKYRTVSIPETYEGLKGATENYPVREIEQSAFAGNKVFTSVTVGKHIAKIGEGAFSGTVNLKSLTLPYIGGSIDAKNEEKLFAYIFGSVSYDSGVTSSTVKTNIVYDDGGTDVSGNTELTYYLPSGLTDVTITGGTLPACAFLNASTLKKVNLPDGIKVISSSAFSGCTSLIEFKLPASVKKIADRAFYGASKLYKFDFNGAAVEEIGKNAFASCSALADETIGSFGFTLPATLKTVGESAFDACVSLKTIDFSATGVTVIPSSAFNGCNSLRKVVLKDGTTVKTAAFKGCSSLTWKGVFDKDGNTVFDKDGNVIRTDDFITEPDAFDDLDFEKHV